MEDVGYLRRQAIFCLRLSEFCSDPPIAAHLTFKAAQFHERALRAEFAAASDFDGKDPPSELRWRRMPVAQGTIATPFLPNRPPFPDLGRSQASHRRTS
jgi:hypothetical protein